MMDREEIYEILETVKDPEIPVISIIDLGILRHVEIDKNGELVVSITPTYTGCPAMDTIEKEIKTKLENAGHRVQVKSLISPAWTTDWITERGRKNLEDYGIAPPAEATTDKSFLTGTHKEIRCPQCKSTNTHMISHFGSTACKALYRCNDCHEPFDYFKCI